MQKQYKSLLLTKQNNDGYHSEVITINGLLHFCHIFLSVWMCMCVSDIVNDYIVTI